VTGRLLATILVAVTVAACGSSGTELRDPPEGATSPSPTSTTTSTTIGFFALTSSAFPIAGELPDTFACEGSTSPPFTWSSVPADAVELALTATSPAADGLRVHWIVAGLSTTSTGIEEGTIPLDAIEGPNSSGGFGWDGPCADPDETLAIDFTLAALTEPSALDPAMTADEALVHLQSLPAVRAVATATVTGDSSGAQTSTTTAPPD
jgi:phosphatidylethanolamine-binding protein (PEBP) family uncharacterized protein